MAICQIYVQIYSFWKLLMFGRAILLCKAMSAFQMNGILIYYNLNQLFHWKKYWLSGILSNITNIYQFSFTYCLCSWEQNNEYTKARYSWSSILISGNRGETNKLIIFILIISTTNKSEGTFPLAMLRTEYIGLKHRSFVCKTF